MFKLKIIDSENTDKIVNTYENKVNQSKHWKHSLKNTGEMLKKSIKMITTKYFCLHWNYSWISKS